MRKRPERDLERACSDLLQYDGWRVLRMEPISRREWGKGVGELGMADVLYLRYGLASKAEVMWIEWKAPGGKARPHQRAWIAAERYRGARVLLAGVDFPASVDGFLEWYRCSGLMVRKL